MAVRPLNSIAGFSTGDPAITIVQANGDITTINLTANGVSNLGPIANVRITGGSNGQAITTDGAGNLVFSTISSESNRAAVMPYLIPTGESYIVNENFQGLYSQAITIDGELEVNGMLIEIVDTVASEDTQVLFDFNGIPTGNAGFTFSYFNGNLSVPGNVNVPNANVVALGVKTNNFYYANGQPWTFGQDPAGSNTQIQFNNNGNFDASANLTFSTSTNNLSVTGNVVVSTGAYYGNAAGLTNIPGANITGNISGNISNAAHAVTADSANTANTVTVNAQPNITSLGTLTNLAVSGNAVISGNLTVDGNLIYVNVEELSIEDPIINLQTGANGAPPVANSGKDVGSALNYYDTQARVAFMGWDTSNAEFSFGSQTTIASEVVTFNTLGNVRAQTFKGNVEATTISGNLTTASQANITTVGTLGSLAVTGNVSAGNVSGGNLLSANYLVSNSGCVSINGAFVAYDSGTGAAGIFTSLATDINIGLAANVTVGSTTGTTTLRNDLIVNNNVYANSGTVKGSLLTGTLTTASQPNVTSVGTLTNLSVTGNVTSNTSTANTITTSSTISNRNVVSVLTDTVIDSFSINDYRSAKYIISSQNDDGFESSEVLLIHDDINSYITVYAAINDGGGNIVSITTGVSSGNVELRATGLAANTKIRVIGTYVPVI